MSGLETFQRVTIKVELSHLEILRIGSAFLWKKEIDPLTQDEQALLDRFQQLARTCNKTLAEPTKGDSK